jgi:hypothetical protein
MGVLAYGRFGVCAQLWTDGTYDTKGTWFRPPLVRIGESVAFA